MALRVLFYVSGHGYGHARRAEAVMRALTGRGEGWEIHVRTAAPASLFRDVPGVSALHGGVAIDSGVVERDSFTIDATATLARAVAVVRQKDQLVGEELCYVRRERPSLIVSDIPYLAGDIAQAAGLPAVGVSNFTWDWIYEVYRTQAVACDELLRSIRRSYAGVQTFLQLPLGHQVSDRFEHVVPVPLVAQAALSDPGDVRRFLRAGLPEQCPVVLVGVRGGIGEEVLAAAAAGAPEFCFFHLGPPSARLPANTRPVALGRRLRFADVLRASDIVVSKLGYGIVADSIAARTRILWPARRGFREDEVLQVEAPRYVPALEIPHEDFGGGRWAKYLRRLVGLPFPSEAPPVNGAEVCARIIAEQAGGKG